MEKKPDATNQAENSAERASRLPQQDNPPKSGFTINTDGRAEVSPQAVESS